MKYLQLLSLLVLFTINAGFSQPGKVSNYKSLKGQVSKITTISYTFKHDSGHEIADTISWDTLFYNKYNDEKEHHSWIKTLNGQIFQKNIYEYTYNNKNQKVEKKTYGIMGQIITLTNIQKFDEGGKVTEDDFYNHKNLKSKTFYSYNDETVKLTKYEKDSLVNKREFNYNKDENIIDYSMSVAKGETEYTYDYKYGLFDHQGNWQRIIQQEKINSKPFGEPIIIDRQITYYQQNAGH